jgi:hypothetical protein
MTSINVLFVQRFSASLHSLDRLLLLPMVRSRKLLGSFPWGLLIV